MRNFEDVVIFVTDMERAVEKLNALEKKLLAMNVLEEYTIPEVARLLSCTQRTAERFLQDALDQFSRILLAAGLMEKLPLPTRGRESCQEGKNYNLEVSCSKEGKNKYRKIGGTPPLQFDILNLRVEKIENSEGRDTDRALFLFQASRWRKRKRAGRDRGSRRRFRRLRRAKKSRSPWQSRSSRSWGCMKSSLPYEVARATVGVT